VFPQTTFPRLLTLAAACLTSASVWAQTRLVFTDAFPTSEPATMTPNQGGLFRLSRSIDATRSSNCAAQQKGEPPHGRLTPSLPSDYRLQEAEGMTVFDDQKHERREDVSQSTRRYKDT
jgi:hypothetical protein